MSDVARQLIGWAEEIELGTASEVIAVDFRGDTTVQAAVIGVPRSLALGELVSQLIVLAFNTRHASDIETAVAMSGIPCTRVRSTFFGPSCGPDHDNDRRGDIVAVIVTDDGRRDDLSEPTANHQVMKVLSRITKRPVVYIDGSKNIARHSMRQLGVPASLIEGLLQHKPLAIAHCPKG
jgi:hypothetical protein